MEQKNRSIFGLIIGILAALDTFLMYSNINNMVSSSTTDGAYALGLAIGARLIQPFLTFALLSAVACLIGFFARFKWGYLTGAVLMAIGILQLPAIVGVPTEPAILAVLMFVAFVIDNYKQNKQAKEKQVNTDKENE